MLPENSLAAFAHALDAGVDRIEIDINLSADDALLVVHDEATNPDIVRDEDGRWIDTRLPWRSLTLDAVRRFDIGRLRPASGYAARFPAQRSVDGSKIPLLDDVADLIEKRGRGAINIEIKCAPNAPPPRPGIEHFAEVVVAAIHRRDLCARVTVQSFNWSVVQSVRALAPALVTGCLSSERADFDTIGRSARAPSPWTAGLRVDDFDGSVPAMVAAMGVHYWAGDHRDLGEESIGAAHALGLQAHAWTVNDPDDMRRLISWGIDSIISDYPDILVAVCRNNK